MTTNTAYGYAAPPANVMSAAAFPVPYVTPVPIRNQKCCSNGLLKPGQRPCTPNRMATLCGFLFAAALVLAIGLAGDSPLSTLKPIKTTSSYYYYRPRLLCTDENTLALNNAVSLGIVAIVVSWIPTICSTAVACRCRCAVSGCGPCCACGPEAQISHSIAWGWYLMLSATGLWITQLTFVGLAASKCNYCSSWNVPAPPPPRYSSSYYNNYYSYSDYVENCLARLPEYGLGTAAAFTAALGTLLSIPAVLLSEAVIMIKQQRIMAQLHGMMVVPAVRPLEMGSMGGAASV